MSLTTRQSFSEEPEDMNESKRSRIMQHREEKENVEWHNLIRRLPDSLKEHLNEDYYSYYWCNHRLVRNDRNESKLVTEMHEKKEEELVEKYQKDCPRNITTTVQLAVAAIAGVSHTYISGMWVYYEIDLPEHEKEFMTEDLWLRYDNLLFSLPSSVRELLPKRPGAFSQLQNLSMQHEKVSTIISDMFLQTLFDQTAVQKKCQDMMVRKHVRHVYHGPLEQGKVYTIDEIGPLTLVNEIGTDGIAFDFQFLSDWDLSAVCQLPFFRNGDWLNFQADCECRGKCHSNDCSHVDFQGCPYDSEGRLIFEKVGQNLLSECNNRCSCGSECGNRVVQKGAKVALQIYKTLKKGWGVRAMQPIRRGTFVGQYIGEVIPKSAGNARVKSEYLFDIDAARPRHKYSVDAAKKGNVTRFFNHCCTPNLQIFNVLTESLNHELHRLAYFAVRDIQLGEELTFDYQYDTKKKEVPCFCESKECRGFYK